jgi:FkbM family methyltransferase
MAERPVQVTAIHEMLGRILPPTPTIIEIGANTGQDTELILKSCKGSYRYFALEPDPSALKLLKERQLPIQIIESAIGSFNGTTKLYHGYAQDDPDDVDYTVYSSILEPTKFFFEQKINVSTLDYFAAQHQIEHIDFMWVDIQGSEFNMIQGGQQTLSNTDWLYIEVANRPRYVGERVENEVLEALPGEWKIDRRYSYKDRLLRRVQ